MSVVLHRYITIHAREWPTQALDPKPQRYADICSSTTVLTVHAAKIRDIVNKYQVSSINTNEILIIIMKMSVMMILYKYQ